MRTAHAETDADDALRELPMETFARMAERCRTDGAR